MMTLSEYLDGLKGKSISVIGLGVSNMPLINLLLEAGVTVIGRDKKARHLFGPELSQLEERGLRLCCGNDYLNDLNEDIIFRTPGLYPNTPQLKAAESRGSVITSEMEVFFHVCPCPIIAVTGSDGKTTTSSIIAELLKKAGFGVHLGGNIGNPLLATASDITPGDFAVLELSSFQLMTMKMSPHIAVVTNMSPNHLDYHLDMDEYIDAKMNIFLHQGMSDKLVLNLDNDITYGFTKLAKGDTRHFSLKTRPEHGFFFCDGTIYLMESEKETPIIESSRILLPGEHNIENLMAAFSAVYDIVGLDICRTVAETFPGVEHRMEKVCHVEGVTFYNDSIASSPSRTIAALNSFDRKLILIAGGYDKNIPYDQLGQVIRDKVKVLILTGATAEKIKDAVMDCDNGNCPEIVVVPDFENAVLTAASKSDSGDIVLLSPASASFDMFKDFAERGRYFKDIVTRL